MDKERTAKTVFTIGHSNRSIEDFLALVKRHNIEYLVDVRSAPFSKFSPQFNQDNLKLALIQAARKYLFLGRELGGKPQESQFYDDEGYVLYWKIAESELFRRAIDRLRNGIELYKVALLCGEEDPTQCHRRLLIGRVLKQHAVEVLHIRGDGSVQNDAELEALSEDSLKQMKLFTEPEKSEPWRSAQPVLRK